MILGGCFFSKVAQISGDVIAPFESGQPSLFPQISGTVVVKFFDPPVVRIIYSILFIHTSFAFRFWSVESPGNKGCFRNRWCF